MKYHRDGFTFSWEGGAYIEISIEGSDTPFEVFNVWDYATDTPTIKKSMRGLVDCVDERIEDFLEAYGVST